VQIEREATMGVAAVFLDAGYLEKVMLFDHGGADTRVTITGTWRCGLATMKGFIGSRWSASGTLRSNGAA